MKSFIFSFEIDNVVGEATSEARTPDRNIFLWSTASVAPAVAAVNANGIKMLLANGLSTFPIKDNPDFSNGPKILLKNPPDFPNLCNSAFDNFILPDERFARALQSFQTCELVNNSLCGKLFSSLKLPTTFD